MLPNTIIGRDIILFQRIEYGPKDIIYDRLIWKPMEEPQLMQVLADDNLSICGPAY